MDPNIFDNNQLHAGMILCTSGRREVMINGKFFSLDIGTLCFASPIITILEISRTEDYEEISILTPAVNIYQVIREIYDLVLKLRLRESPCIKLDKQHFDFFISRRNEILEKEKLAHSATDKNEHIVLQHIVRLLTQETMLEFIHLYYTNCEVTPATSSKYDSVLFKFMLTLNQNFRQHRDTAFYASSVNLSKSHFTRIICEKTGKTPSQWIADITILNAKLLLKSDLSIKEIAAELCFPEQFTFRKFFKHHTGLSPREYRKSNLFNQ
ncbi:MAG: helix-turn-helix domain-containing protein [Muribaculaceae bacterium]